MEIKANSAGIELEVVANVYVVGEATDDGITCRPDVVVGCKVLIELSHGKVGGHDELTSRVGKIAFNVVPHSLPIWKSGRQRWGSCLP